MKNIYSLSAFKERWNSRPVILQPSGDNGLRVERNKNLNLPWRQAAVLIGLIERDEQTRIIFTQRAHGMRDHSGQISFPGGKVESFDKTFEKTALREANEEIGLLEKNVYILGRLPHYYTGTGFEIVPIVGVVDKQQTFMSNSLEVASTFDVPLSFLMNPDNHEQDKREFDGKQYTFYAMSYKNHYIWGATAGMIRLLFERLYR